MILPLHLMILPYPLEEFTRKEHFTQTNPRKRPLLLHLEMPAETDRQTDRQTTDTQDCEYSANSSLLG